MKDFKEFLEEEQSQASLATYIANNLYRLGNRKNTNQASMLLLVAASILSQNENPQSMAAARRLVQLAISKQQRT